MKLRRTDPCIPRRHTAADPRPRVTHRFALRRQWFASCYSRAGSWRLAFVCFLIALTRPAISPAAGGTLFIDDFDDGSAVDGSPVAWSPHPNEMYRGHYGVVDGWYGMTNKQPNQPIVATVDGVIASDVSIRATARLTDISGEAGLLARASTTNETAYQGGIHSNGEVYLGWNDPAFHYFTRARTDLRILQQDVLLQLDVFGNRLSFWAWPAGAPRPVAPLLTAIDNRYASGVVGLLYQPIGNSLNRIGSGRFDVVQAGTVSIPEPPALTLTLLALCGARVYRMRFMRWLP